MKINSGVFALREEFFTVKVVSQGNLRILQYLSVFRVDTFQGNPSGPERLQTDSEVCRELSTQSAVKASCG